VKGPALRLLIFLVALLLLLAFVIPAMRDAQASTRAGAQASASAPARASRIVLPEVPPLYRLMVEREAADVWGINPPTARIAAQIHQESGWDPKAASKYAQGMAQFTPATAAWIAQQFPRELGDFDPWNPAHSVRAMVFYDRWLLQRVSGASECDRWAFALSGYNGGLGWVKRDQRRASAKGADSARWFGHVDAHSARAGWALKENRGYVRNILLRWEPAYLSAGWSGSLVCEVSP
jgi:soluble lytic murein transglycosylase-like protein